MNASNLNYNLIFKGIYIMNNDTLLSLFDDDRSRIILGTVLMSNFSFILKQTLPNISGIIKSIFLDENKYLYGI